MLDMIYSSIKICDRLIRFYTMGKDFFSKSFHSLYVDIRNLDNKIFLMVNISEYIGFWGASIIVNPFFRIRIYRIMTVSYDPN